jgi:hypothetical protein
MPQLNAIVLSDGTDNHTFSPRGVDNSGVATLVKSSGVPVADERLTIARSRTSAGREKVTVKMTIPVVQDVVVAGVSRPTVVRAAYADLTFSFDGTSSTEERSDIRTLLADLLVDAAFEPVVDELETLY